jgi:hypothetical protein
MRDRIQWTLLGVVLVTGNSVHGEVFEFTNRDEWFAAVGLTTTIDFTGYPDGTIITSQYTDSGVVFTDGNDAIAFNDIAYPNDGFGLKGNGWMFITFLTPQAYIAVDFPGFLMIQLFNQGALLYASDVFGEPPGGGGHFAGLVSGDFFDSAVIRPHPQLGTVSIDDLHFGVPAPPALVPLALAALVPRRRRVAAAS